MDANEDKTIGCSDGVFEDAEGITLLLGEEGDFRSCSRLIRKVKDLLDVLAASGGEKVTLPRVPITILLEGFEV